MLLNEIHKLNARLETAFQVKRLLVSGLVIPVRTDNGQLLHDPANTATGITLEDWPDAQVFYVQEGSNVTQQTPARKVEVFEISAIIYTNLPEFLEFFKSQLDALKFDYTGSVTNPVSVVNQFLPGLNNWNHERELYALTFNVTLPIRPAACVQTCF